jgi:hypothetical protein
LRQLAAVIHRLLNFSPSAAERIDGPIRVNFLELIMQFSKMMFAVASLACGSVMATTAPANIAISSGASASKGNLKLALANRCSATLAEYVSGANISTYVCAAGTFSATPTATEYANSTPVNFTGTAFAELRLNVNGGSFTAVCLVAGWPAGTSCPAADTYLEPSTGTLLAPPAGSISVGGLMDVEPNAFLPSVRANIAPAPVLQSANFAQTFGVAASDALYQAMFTQQLAAGKLPATCVASDTAKPECVPVIGKAQMATIMSSNSSNAAYAQGAAFLAPGLAAGTNLNYARRVDTSGTQAAAQQYFLGNVCSTGSLTVVPVGAGTTGTVTNAITVFGFPTTGGVRTLLNTAGAYTIGIVSGENNQTGQTWKWLRVAGMQMAENAAPGTAQANTTTALDGRYDMWFLSRVVQPSAANAPGGNALWNSIRTGFGAVPAGTTPGLFATSETNYTKGTNACQPPASN